MPSHSTAPLDALAPPSALRSLHRVAVATGGVLDPPALAGLVVRHARSLLGAEAAHLYAWDARTGGLRIVASTDPFRLGGDEPVAPGEGVAGQAFVQRQAVVVGDYRAWEHAAKGSMARGVRAAVAAPLLASDRVVGVLAVRFETMRAFRSDPVPILALLAAQVAPNLAAALDTAQQQADERRARHQAEEVARQREQIVASAAHDLRSSLAAINGLAQMAAHHLDALNGPEAAQAAEHLARIDATSGRMTRRLDELLDVTQEAGRRRPMSPRGSAPREASAGQHQNAVDGQQARPVETHSHAHPEHIRDSPVLRSRFPSSHGAVDSTPGPMGAPMAAEALLRQAIAQRRLVAFDLGSDYRIVEPHVLGLKGRAKHLLAYQVAGTTSRGSSIGWRIFALTELANVRVLERGFLASRNWGGRHSAFDTILDVVRDFHSDRSDEEDEDVASLFRPADELDDPPIS